MKVFRRKYLYNPQNPVFQNSAVKTYNCLDTQTKNNRLLLLQHLTPPPLVPSSPYILQPIQSPQPQEPFSIYPLINCCSEIGKLNENDAIYIIKCLVQAKMSNCLYYGVSPDGIVCSKVEGLLPDRSPDLFSLALDLLDLPPNLIEVEKSVVSRQGYAICRAIKDGTIDLTYFTQYGWKDVKANAVVKDNDFWVFKGRRKQEGPFGDQYGLAWNAQHGICKFKFIDLNKDSYQEDFQEDFQRRVAFYKNNNSKNIQLVSIHKIQKDFKGIKMFMSICNQGNLSQYIQKKSELKFQITEQNILTVLEMFVKMMTEIARSPEVRGHTALHIKFLHVHNNRLTLGQPLFVTQKIQKKLRDLKKGFDYFAPEFKENIILPQKLFRLNQEKLDIWSFGYLLHKMFTEQVPLFDSATRTPIIEKNRKLSSGMISLIKRCLRIDPEMRPKWQQINLRNLQKDVLVEQFEQQQIKSKKVEQIRLDSPSVKSKKQKMSKQTIKQAESQKFLVKQQQAKIIPQEQPQLQQKMEYILPAQISSKLKRIKLTLKIIAIMCMYILVFFGSFISNSFQILILKDYVQKTPLNLVSLNGSILSSTTILTSQSKFFLFNDISFSDVQNKYHCINDNFDPINNPTYSLYSYITDPKFAILIYMGWLMALIICVIKALSIWKGGISNRPRKPSPKYWLVYTFHQLTMSSLLFAHFFIFQFFYFAGISPCFFIQSFGGVVPFFDSSLYLFLANQDGYMLKVFSSLGVLAVVLCISSCFYAWGPKLDMKYFVSVPSIICRLIPYILLFLMCRIGVFSLFSPTALSDSTSILPSILSNSSKGVFYIIPEIFIIICITIEVLLQVLTFWCEQKASQNDSLSKMFNINDKKFLERNNSGSLGRNGSYNLNEMSLQNSKQIINQDD